MLRFAYLADPAGPLALLWGAPSSLTEFAARLRGWSRRDGNFSLGDEARCELAAGEAVTVTISDNGGGTTLKAPALRRTVSLTVELNWFEGEGNEPARSP